MPEHLRPTWTAWQLISAGWATLPELETSWSIDDAEDAADALESIRIAEHKAGAKQ